MKEACKQLLRNLRNFVHVTRISCSGQYREERDMAFVLRYTHSIEKGLALKSPRPGFGREKISAMLAMLERYHAQGKSMDRTVFLMALDAVKAYLAYHESIGYSDQTIDGVKAAYHRIDRFIPEHADCMGGVIRIENRKPWSDEERALFCRMVESRHSIRQFAGTEVDVETLKHAIDMASHAPSACNRQATRTYILKGSRKNAVLKWLSGVGGFAEEVNAYIMITAKQSCYNLNEQYQYIVSSSIFAGYLTMALEAYNIGACVIQRPVLYNRRWSKIAAELGIAKDEQLILMVGCGHFAESYKVPVSHRMLSDELCSVIE